MAELIVREVASVNLDLLQSLVVQIEAYPEAIPRIMAKLHQRVLLCPPLAPHTALLFKQELLARGGDALIASAVYLGMSIEPAPALGWCSDRGWQQLAAQLQQLPLPECVELGRAIQTVLNQPTPTELECAGQRWVWGERTLVMGILNITPDSFSQDGLLAGSAMVAPTAQAQAFAAAGADILDIGGESTRPGAQTISADEELQRVLPAIEAIRAVCSLPISIDTYKAEVAAAALKAGASIINDIWALRTPQGEWNTALATVAATAGAPLMLMHNRRARTARTSLGGHFTDIEYSDIMADICGELSASIQFALTHGIKHSRLIIDPGLGFGKTPDQNIEVLQRLGELKSLGLPLLVGTSRKSFIGLALNAPVGQRIHGTAATVALAITQGADIVRVHDVAAMVDVARMTDALVRPGAWRRLTAHTLR